MSLKFQTSLSKLERLSPKKLDKTSRRIRGDMADAEWKMGLCLLALKRSGAFRKLGFGTLSAYAERVLELSGRKVGALLGAAEALEHLPLMSEAFRAGQVCWSKVRVMHGLATPETEAEWLEFAKVHTSVEVERKVALSPLEWKRHRALKASLEGKPSVSSEEVTEFLLSTPTVTCGVSSDGYPFREKPKGSGVAGREGIAFPEATAQEGRQEHDGPFDTQDGASNSEDNGRNEKIELSASSPADARPTPPSPPKTIRLVFELTPDQYALYEQAESRVRAQEGRRLPRAGVLKRMAESVLSQGTAKARARHQVLVHTMEGSDEAWYETERGVLPVASEVLNEALECQDVLLMNPNGRIAAAPVPESSNQGSLKEHRRQHLRVQDNPIERSFSQENAEDEEPKDRSDRASDEPLVPQARPGAETAGRETLPLELPVDHTSDSQDSNNQPPASHTSVSRPKRTAIPNATIRQVFARAGHRCECCGRKGGRLDVHHRDPVSEGGSSSPGSLELLCRACHTKKHESDFEEKSHWSAARDMAMVGRASGHLHRLAGTGDYAPGLT